MNMLGLYFGLIGLVIVAIIGFVGGSLLGGKNTTQPTV
jgi:hypothetical protein